MKNHLIYNIYTKTMEYIKNTDNTHEKQHFMTKLLNEDYTYLKDALYDAIEFKQGKLCRKLGPGHSHLNQTSFNIIACSLAKFLLQYNRKLSIKHPKKYLSTDEVSINNHVFIGFDNRLNSKEFADLFGVIFSEHGIDVHLSTEPTIEPFIAYLATIPTYKLCMYVTGHSQSKEFSGASIYCEDGCLLSDDLCTLLNDIITKTKPMTIKKNVTLNKIDLKNQAQGFYYSVMNGLLISMGPFYRRAQTRNVQKIIIASMYSPIKELFDYGIKLFNLEGIFEFYKPHLRQDYTFADKDDLYPSENDITDKLIQFAESKKSELIFLTCSNGIKFRIYLKIEKKWRFFSYDEMVAVFLCFFRTILLDNEVTIINTFDCSNLGILFAMKYYFRYVRADFGSNDYSELFCKYRRYDKQTLSLFVYNDQFDFCISKIKIPNAIYNMIALGTFFQFELPETALRKIKYDVGDFVVLKYKVECVSNKNFMKDFMKRLKDIAIEYYYENELIEFLYKRGTYVMCKEVGFVVKLRIYIDRIVPYNINNYTQLLFAAIFGDLNIKIVEDK